MNSKSLIVDISLVTNIKNNSREAFEELYNRYKKKLYYFSLKYLKEEEDAEDLVQSVFVSIWEHRTSLNEDLSIKSYIYKSAINYIYSHLKKKAIRTRFIDQELIKTNEDSNPTYDNIFFHDMEKSINRIIETLPQQQQQIFLLSRFEGLSHDEIAKKLHLSIRTIENQVYRAIKSIKSHLQREIL